MHGGHFDDKRKQVVDDCIQELVGHLSPRQRSHALELVIQVQLQANKWKGLLSNNIMESIAKPNRERLGMGKSTYNFNTE